MNLSFKCRLDHLNILIIADLTQKNLENGIFMKIRLFVFYEIFKLLSRPRKFTYLNKLNFIL